MKGVLRKQTCVPEVSSVCTWVAVRPVNTDSCRFHMNKGRGTYAVLYMQYMQGQIDMSTAPSTTSSACSCRMVSCGGCLDPNPPSGCACLNLLYHLLGE